MRRMAVWFCLSIKRWLLHPGFTVMLLVMPILLWGISRLEPEETERIRIGVASEDPGLGREVAEDLVRMGTEGSMFEFVLYHTEEELKQAVRTRQAECAYLFPEGFEEKMNEGRYRRSILVYTAPSTILEPLAGEVVISVLAARYDGMMFADYIGNQGKEGELLKEGALSWYQVYQENGSTFGFEFRTSLEEPVLEKKSVFPVRGLIGIFVFLSAFFAACSVKEDERNGLFLAVPYGERTVCRIGALAAPVCLAALSGLAGLWAAGEVQNAIMEMAALTVCGAGAVFYAGLACMAVPKPEWIAMCIPVLALGLFLICPIFIDIGKWLDVIGTIRWFLPPAWYLQFF